MTEFVDGVSCLPLYLSALQEIFTLVFHSPRSSETVVMEKGSWSYYFLYCFFLFVVKNLHLK